MSLLSPKTSKQVFHEKSSESILRVHVSCKFIQKITKIPHICLLNSKMLLLEPILGPFGSKRQKYFLKNSAPLALKFNDTLISSKNLKISTRGSTEKLQKNGETVKRSNWQIYKRKYRQIQNVFWTECTSNDLHPVETFCMFFENLFCIFFIINISLFHVNMSSICFTSWQQFFYRESFSSTKSY